MPSVRASTPGMVISVMGKPKASVPLAAENVPEEDRTLELLSMWPAMRSGVE